MGAKPGLLLTRSSLLSARRYLVFATSRTREAEAYDAEPAEHAPDAGSESETDDEADDERPRRAPAKSSEAVLVKAYADDDDPSDASSHTEADTDSVSAPVSAPLLIDRADQSMTLCARRRTSAR